ncbi:MAG: hypothetical protein ABI768_12170 [Acidobacteriota bacterium]
MFVLLTLLVEAARLFVPPGTLPKGSRVEIVQVETGRREVREVGEGAGAAPDFRTRAGTFVVSVFGADGRMRGFTRITAKKDDEIAIFAPSSSARGRGQLSVDLTFPKDAKPDPRDVALLLVGHEMRLAPDVFVFTGGTRAKAFWLDVPAGRAAIALTSRGWTLAKPLSSEVPERGAVAVSGEAVERPSLRLLFDVAESVGHGNVEVDLLNCENERNFPGPVPIERCAPIVSGKGRSDEGLFFEGLDPVLFAVRWKLGKWSDTVMVDMQNARPVEKRIAVRPFEVSGRVTAGGAPTAAKLRFWAVNTGHSFETEAGDDGIYRLALVRRGWYTVGIRRPGAPRFGAELKLEGGELRDEHADFDVPLNRVVVRILEARVGQPIPGAEVFVEDGRGNFSEHADSEGKATLPPLEKGWYEITGRAKGHQRSKPQRILVDESTGEREIEIRLQPSADVRIRVLDAHGTLAVRAAVGVMEVGGDTVSGALTDDQGVALLPDPISKGQALAVWDAGGRIGVFRWSGEEQQDLVMPRPGPPVAVRFVAPDGEPRPRWATLFAIDGIAYRDGSTRIAACGGDHQSRPDGTFRICGLPATGTLRIWPFGKPDLAVTRPLPVTEEIVFTVPAR